MKTEAQRAGTRSVPLVTSNRPKAVFQSRLRICSDMRLESMAPRNGVPLMIRGSLLVD